MNQDYSILIIDDNDDNIELLSRQLTTQGFKTQFVNEAPKALHTLKKEKIDLVLLDINMPVIDGITLLSNIRKDKTLDHVAIIMLTADESIKSSLECLKKGACGYVTKPYDIILLRKQINNCLNLS